jgi:putative FmdB family regulatory protein
MACYEFQCKKCDAVYEELCEYDATEKYKGVKCPECGSKSKTKLMSMANFAFSNPEGTDRWNNGSTGHDYRFKHNVPKVQAERQMAEQMSHMGANPYGPDTSAKDIELDTGVHDAETRGGLS